MPRLRPLPAAFLAALLALWLALPAAAAELRLRLLETTDLHMNLLAWDYYQDKPTEEYGLARTISLIKGARAEVPNSLLFDNGDLLQGSPLGDWVARVRPLAEGEVHPAYKVLNALGADAANVGNHEFNYGLDFLRRAIAGARFPYVSANVVVDRPGVPDEQLEPAFPPYVVLQREFTDDAGARRTLKIGVIGFLPPQIMLWDRQNLLGRLKSRDILDSARRWLPRLKAEGADLVVALAHSGFERGETAWFAENAVARLAEVPGIDAILFGHSHGEFPGRFFAGHAKVDLARGTINGIPAVMPGRFGDHLGVVDLVLDDAGGRWRVKDSRAEIRPITDRATRKPRVDADPVVAALIGPEHAATRALMNAEVARTSAPITSYFAQVAPDPSVQLVSRAQMHYARRALQGTPHEGLPLLSAAAPFKSGGRMGWSYYTDVPAGTLTMRHIADLYVYPNTLCAVKVSGATVREWLEVSAGQFRRIDPQGPPQQELLSESFRTYNFDMIEGLEYAIDVTQPARYDANGRLVAPAARRIVDLRWRGEPLDDRQDFIVVTNNYRANGGGGFPGLDGTQIVLNAGDESREALRRWLQDQREVDGRVAGHWRLKPVPGVELQFTSGAGGIAHLPRHPAIGLVRELGDGSARYRFAQ